MADVGAAQNAFHLGNKSLSRLYWNKREWNAVECAKEVKEALRRKHPYLASFSKRGLFYNKIENTKTTMQLWREKCYDELQKKFTINDDSEKIIVAV